MLLVPLLPHCCAYRTYIVSVTFLCSGYISVCVACVHSGSHSICLFMYLGICVHKHFEYAAELSSDCVFFSLSVSHTWTHSCFLNLSEFFSSVIHENSEIAYDIEFMVDVFIFFALFIFRLVTDYAEPIIIDWNVIQACKAYWMRFIWLRHRS